MKENMKGLFSGMPKRDGVERIGFMLLFPVGIALCLLRTEWGQSKFALTPFDSDRRKTNRYL
jgi:hypothetical protein